MDSSNPHLHSERRFDVLAVSDMCVDLILTGDVHPRFGQAEQIVDDYLLELGGSANIFVSQVVKLGGKGAVIGYVGNDSFGEFVSDQLRNIGVETEFLKTHPDLKTGLGVALAEKGDRAILTYSGTIDATTQGDLPADLLLQTRHWHVASFFLLESLRPFWKEWLRECKKAGVTTSMDTNWDPADQWNGVEDLLPHIDVFLPNEEEALRITGAPDCLAALDHLTRVGNLIVIKRGKHGALAARGNTRWEFRVPQNESIEIVDSIGAGDNFDAGFIWGLMQDWSIDRCLKLAHTCGSASLSRAGGIAGQLRHA